MAKKNQDPAEKKVKSNKVKSNKVKGKSMLEDINAKLKLSQKELQRQVDELRSQVKVLSKDTGKTAGKLIKKMDKNYRKKLAQLHNEFDERMESVHKAQDKIIGQLPTELVEKLHLKASNVVKPATKASKKATVKVDGKNIEKLKTVAKTTKSTTPTIASIKGIGPVLQKKLADAGFTSLEDLANISASKTEALKPFEKNRGSTTWQQEAQALLDNK
jgi:predicted flap endonuclease-1-like 5' DNA nuclease